MAKKDKKNKIETEGHLTSIITSDDEEIEKDPLSREIRSIREDIASLDKTDTAKLEELLRRFNAILIENCDRIKKDYEVQGCPDVEVEPAIGYFIPHVDEQDALLKGVEPSVIVTAKDLSEDGLDRFLLAAGKIGESYSQEAEILKFPIEKAKFDDYVTQKAHSPASETSFIGTVTDDNIIPTFEIIVDLPALLGDLAAHLSEDYLENIELYANIILQLAEHNYAASTWPIKGTGFSTLYIRGWDEAKRSFEEWFKGIANYLDSFAKGDSGEIEEGVRMGRKASTESNRSSLQGYRRVNELLIIPQKEPGILSGDDLLYADLRSDKKRRALIKKLTDIL